MDTLSPSYLFVFSVVAAVILTRIPFIGKYVRVLNTLFHESGHSLTAMLLNAEVLQAELFSDTSGSALTKTDKKWKKFFISLSGYPISALSAWALFYLGIREWYYWGLLGIIVLIIVNLTLFVRNTYGIFWLITYGIITGIVLYFRHPLVMRITLYMSAAVILVESIVSVVQLLMIAWHSPNKAGDAKNLKDITHIPVLFWVLLFIFITGFVSWDIIIRFININI